MPKSVFLLVGVALLCAMPILGTFVSAQDGHTRTARLAAPTQVLTAPLAY
ncbi:hypothetical protein [Pseudooceanicola onchidii]|nr:hypothetical protein [Pseudooceanicola onchidii]